MFQHEVENLKVGDLVAISPTYRNTNSPYVTDAKVTKVNGHGHVTIEKDKTKWVVDKRGNEYGRSKSSSYYYSLVDNDTAKSRNAARVEQDRLNAEVNAILKVFSDHKTYNGDYKISTDVKTILTRLIIAL